MSCIWLCCFFSAGALVAQLGSYLYAAVELVFWLLGRYSLGSHELKTGLSVIKCKKKKKKERKEKGKEEKRRKGRNKGEEEEEITWVGTNSGKLNMSNVFNNGVWYEDFPAGSEVKNLPVNAGDAGSSLGQEDPLEKEMATHFSILAWGTSMDRQQPLEWQRVRHDLGTNQ